MYNKKIEFKKLKKEINIENSIKEYNIKVKIRLIFIKKIKNKIY